MVSALLAVRLPTSGETRSHGVTGGVYKTRERIHRGILDPRLLSDSDFTQSVATAIRTTTGFMGISPSRVGNPLYQPLAEACSPPIRAMRT